MPRRVAWVASKLRAHGNEARGVAVPLARWPEYQGKRSEGKDRANLGRSRLRERGQGNEKQRGAGRRVRRVLRVVRLLRDLPRPVAVPVWLLLVAWRDRAVVRPVLELLHVRLGRRGIAVRGVASRVARRLRRSLLRRLLLLPEVEALALFALRVLLAHLLQHVIDAPLHAALLRVRLLLGGHQGPGRVAGDVDRRLLVGPDRVGDMVRHERRFWRALAQLRPRNAGRVRGDQPEQERQHWESSGRSPSANP